MNGKSIPTFGRLSPEDQARLIAKYRKCFVPGHRPTFHRYRRYGMSTPWPLVLDKNEEPRRLSDFWVELHLRGKMLLAPRWELASSYRFAVIDLDYPWLGFVSEDPSNEERQHHLQRSQVAAAEFSAHVSKIRRALRPARCLFIRSSSSLGLHLYLFFDKAYPADAIRAVLIARLKKHGIEVKTGVVEVWPNNNALRLPLGTQSHVVSARKLNVKYPNQRGSKLYRDTKSDILHAVAFAKKHAVSLRVLGRAVTGVAHSSSNNTLSLAPATAGSPASPRVKPSPRSLTGASTRNPHFWAEIEACRDGITAYGQRFREGSQYFYYLLVVQRWPATVALAQYEDWLRTRVHKSKDLERDREGTIQRMLHGQVSKFV